MHEYSLTMLQEAGEYSIQVSQLYLQLLEQSCLLSLLKNILYMSQTSLCKLWKCALGLTIGMHGCVANPQLCPLWCPIIAIAIVQTLIIYSKLSLRCLCTNHKCTVTYTIDSTFTT